MRTLCTALLAGSLLLAPLLRADDTQAQKEQPVKVDKKVVSYSIGTEIARNLKPIAKRLDMDMVVKGLKDALAGRDLKYSQDEMREATQAFAKVMHEEQGASTQKDADKNQKEGDAYLKDNAKKDGWKVTDSGLQIKMVKEGDGPKPAPSDKVKVHYEGRLIDGTVFDSWYKRGEPIVFPVTGVIPGWVEALQLMKVGSKAELAIPGNLAYGRQGSGGSIGPNATLLFTVELLGIEK